jgi:O-antigen/teichoic acid export membrane protein
MASGLVATVLLDILLIPRYGAIGASVASAVSSFSATVTLVGFFWWLRRPVPAARKGEAVFATR